MYSLIDITIKAILTTGETPDGIVLAAIIMLIIFGVIAFKVITIFFALYLFFRPTSILKVSHSGRILLLIIFGSLLLASIFSAYIFNFWHRDHSILVTIINFPGMSLLNRLIYISLISYLVVIISISKKLKDR